MGIFKRCVVGMEIDSKEIRIVQVEGTPEKFGFQSFARFPLEKGIVKDGKVVSPDRLASAISMLWATQNVRSRDVILGINNQDIIVRFAALPKISADKLENLIRFQSMDYIPIPIDDIELDYMVTGEIKNDSGEFLKVLLVAGRKYMLFDFLKAFKQARLNIIDITPSMLSMNRLIPAEYINLPVAVINLSHDFGNIVLKNRNELVLARTFGYPYDLAPSISTFYENTNITGMVSFDEGTLEPMCDFLAEEIRSSVLYYRNQNPEANFQSIILTGCLSRAKGLVDRLKQITGANVSLLSLPVTSGIQKKFNRASYLSGSMDLAHNLKQFNDRKAYRSQEVPQNSSFHPADFSVCTGLAIDGLGVS